MRSKAVLNLRRSWRAVSTAGVVANTNAHRTPLRGMAPALDVGETDDRGSSLLVRPSATMDPMEPAPATKADYDEIVASFRSSGETATCWRCTSDLPIMIWRLCARDARRTGVAAYLFGLLRSRPSSRTCISSPSATITVVRVSAERSMSASAARSCPRMPRDQGDHNARQLPVRSHSIAPSG